MSKPKSLLALTTPALKKAHKQLSSDEKKLINLILAYRKAQDEKKVQLILKDIEKSAGFLNQSILHQDVIELLNKIHTEERSKAYGLKEFFKPIRLYVDTYLNEAQEKHDKNITKKQALVLKEIDSFFIQQKSKVHVSELFKGLLLEDFALIRKVFTLGGKTLQDLFDKYLPPITETLFEGHKFPEKFSKEKARATASIEDFLEKNKKLGFDKLESVVIYIQRRIRYKRRLREHHFLVTPRRFHPVPLPLRGTSPNKRSYFPKCKKSLAIRIFKLAENISVFSEIRHLTSPEGMASVLNCLYGRESLEKFYMTYRKAALDEGDIENGDGNVICLGPHDIDPSIFGKSKNGVIEIVLDLKKLYLGEHKNPLIFCKEHDYGYGVCATYQATLGDIKLRFAHGMIRFGPHKLPKPSLFILDKNEGEYKKWGDRDDFINFDKRSHLHFLEMLFYGLENMQQFFIMQFFRHLDQMPEEIKGKIYAKIEKVSDEELKTFLKEVGKALSSRAEFNFYGAFKIKMPYINTIRILNRDQSIRSEIKMSKLLEVVRKNEMKELLEKEKQFLTVFKSYRFIDYLLKHAAPASTTEKYLQSLKNECKIPMWHPSYTAKSSSLGGAKDMFDRKEGPYISEKKSVKKTFKSLHSPMC